MAERIEQTLAGKRQGQAISEHPLSMGLAWSFPIEYVHFIVILESQLTCLDKPHFEAVSFKEWARDFLQPMGYLDKISGI